MRISIIDSCIIVSTVCFTFFLVEGGLLLRDARVKISTLAASYAQLVEPGMKAEASIAAAGLTIAQVGAKERTAFDAQQKYFEDLSKRTDVLLESANATIQLLNQSVVPEISSNLVHSDSLIERSSSAVERISTAAESSINQSAALIESISAGAWNLEPAITNINAIAENSKGISANLEATTGDIKDFVHRETTPVRGTWNMIKNFLKEFAGPAAEVATSIK